MNDTELLDLIPFLEKLSKVDNVYTLLRNSNAPSPPPPTAISNGNNSVSVSLLSGGSGGGNDGSSAVDVVRLNDRNISR